MKTICILFLSLFLLNTVSAQFKNDNVLYKTVDPADLCDQLSKNKGALILDVRSPGEHYDTSSFTALNLGHLKGAKNIEVAELDKRISEIKDYKDKPVFVYCSHSQRSRRASKMLADSGFTKVYNINGGITAFHYKGLKDDGCVSVLYETANSYKIISFNQLCERLQQPAKVFLLDVRPDSAFRHISMDARTNAYGTIKGSVNIPFAVLKEQMGSLPPKNNEIIIIDQNGNDAAKSAMLLKQMGFENISILIEGIDRILSLDSRDLKCKNEFYINPVSYQLFNSTEFGRYARNTKDIVLLDIRTEDEFSNKAKDSWRNIGRLNGAINIPADQLATRFQELDKNKDIVIYGFSSGAEVFRAAALLTKNNFSKLHLLAGGIFNVRWSAGNVKGESYLKDFVVDVPEVNQ